MTHITRRLTAKNRDQFRNPTLGNRVWATFTFFYIAVHTTRSSATAHGPREALSVKILSNVHQIQNKAKSARVLRLIDL